MTGVEGIPDEQSCTCPYTDPATWTTYCGAVEPGSTQEYDPTCPAHGMLRAEVDALRAAVARVEKVAGGMARHAEGADPYWTVVGICGREVMDALRGESE